MEASATSLSGVGACRERTGSTIEHGVVQDLAGVLLNSPKHTPIEGTPRTRAMRLASDGDLRRLCSLSECDPSLADLSKTPSHPNLRARSPKASLFEQSYRTPSERLSSCAPNGRASVSISPLLHTPPSLRGQIELSMHPQSSTASSHLHGDEVSSCNERRPSGHGVLDAQNEQLAFPAPKRRRQKSHLRS
jgi:hypothetical protein